MPLLHPYLRESPARLVAGATATLPAFAIGGGNLKVAAVPGVNHTEIGRFPFGIGRMTFTITPGNLV